MLRSGLPSETGGFQPPRVLWPFSLTQSLPRDGIQAPARRSDLPEVTQLFKRRRCYLGFRKELKPVAPDSVHLPRPTTADVDWKPLCFRGSQTTQAGAPGSEWEMFCFEFLCLFFFLLLTSDAVEREPVQTSLSKNSEARSLFCGEVQGYSSSMGSFSEFRATQNATKYSPRPPFLHLFSLFPHGESAWEWSQRAGRQRWPQVAPASV